MNLKPYGILKGVCIFGLVIALILLGLLVFFSRYGNIPLFSPFLRGTSFSRALEEYDRETAGNPDLSPGKRGALLNSLEKKALDTENHLSVLKRRRALAETGAAAAIVSYAEGADRAGKRYPYSGQIAALRAESIILRWASIESGIPQESGISSTAESAVAEQEKIAELTAIMRGLDELALAFSVYSGAMGDPATARLLPAELFPLLCMAAEGEERERYLVNAAIRSLLGGDIQEALSQVNALFNQAPLRDQTYLFGAEFFYDHGDFVRSAELFSHFTDDWGIARQADALWLAGFAESAGTLWKIAGVDGRPGDARSRSLYNLASVSPLPDEQWRWLEMLFQDDLPYEPGRVFALIRFSRLAPTDRALAILEKTDRSEGLFDLELLRRKSEGRSVNKTVAETWALVNNHPNDPRLYQWAAWYFDFQRRYGETALLLTQAERSGVKEPWIDLHKAFALARENKLPEAEKLLHAVTEQGEYGRFWQIPADLALILDLRRKPREALELYEIAAGLQADTVNRLRSEQAVSSRASSPRAPSLRAAVPELEDAARIQTHIARCLRSLGREAESRRVLDYALDLDPENLDAALEKRRLDNRGIL
jgi:tetratricopeptide (TPR) repeat protein